MDALGMAALDPGKTADDIDALVADLERKKSRVVRAAMLAKPLVNPSAAPFNEMITHLRGAGPAVRGFIRIVRQIREHDRFFTGAEAMAIFRGELSVSSVVEVRVRGLRDADVNPANEDANVVAECRLGSGAAGSVYELTRRDGTSVVFKGETESRTGLAALAAGSGKSYEAEQQAANLNFAAKSAAVALGMPGMIVDYSAGTHNGATTFSFDKDRTDLLKSRLLLLARTIDPASSQALYARMLADPGLSPNAEGGLDVDASRIADKSILHALKEVTGVQTLAVPDKIDRTKRIGGQVAMNVHLLDCPSSFTRDYFDKIFA